MIATSIRLAAYAYLAVGLAALLAPWMVVVLAPVLVLGLLLASWDNMRQPIRPGKWIPLLALASLGVARLILANGPYGGSGGAPS